MRFSIAMSLNVRIGDETFQKAYNELGALSDVDRATALKSISRMNGFSSTPSDDAVKVWVAVRKAAEALGIADPRINPSVLGN